MKEYLVSPADPGEYQMRCRAGLVFLNRSAANLALAATMTVAGARGARRPEDGVPRPRTSRVGSGSPQDPQRGHPRWHPPRSTPAAGISGTRHPLPQARRRASATRSQARTNITPCSPATHASAPSSPISPSSSPPSTRRRRRQRQARTEQHDHGRPLPEAWENPAAHNSLDPSDFHPQRSTVPIRAPAPPIRKVERENGFDWALVSCAVAGRVAGGKITHPRIVLERVSPVPYEATAANSFLDGKTLDAGTAGRAADLVLARAHPQAHNAYKVPIARALIQRSLLQLKAQS